MFATFIVFTIVSCFGFNFNVSLPRMASEIWGNEQWYGWVLAANSVGSMLGSLATASRHFVSIRWMAGMGFLLGVAGICLAWSPDPVLALFVSIPLGIGGAGFVSGMNAITQQECPPVMRGRILALTAVAFLGSYPIGGPITGIVGDQVSLQWSLCYGAIITLMAVGGLVWWALGRSAETSRFVALRNLLGRLHRRGTQPGRASVAMTQRSVVWFRRDLRLEDHPALTEACAVGGVLPLFVIDPAFDASGSPRRAALGASSRIAEPSDRRGARGPCVAIRWTSCRASPPRWMLTPCSSPRTTGRTVAGGTAALPAPCERRDVRFEESDRRTPWSQGRS